MILRLLSLLLVWSTALSAAERPNVLFIAVDDMNNDLGCYGHPLVKTPNLDRLASQGVKFDRAYCQFPLCSPSRSSIMTGLRPDRTKVADLQYHFREGLPGVVTLSQLFKNNGWFSARVGKIYHYGNPGQIGTAGLDDAPSWDLAVNPAGRDKLTDEPDIIQYTGKPMNFGASLSWLAAEGSDSDHTDGKVADEAIRLMEEKKGQPFFLAVGFYKPHTPYVAPKKYFDLYPPVDRIPLASRHAGDRDDIPPMAISSYQGDKLTDEQSRLLRRAYWACISFADAQIGRVLDSLDRLMLREKTIVVFWSDHGYHLGEHGLWQKQTCFEEAARVPFIIAAPRTKARSICRAPACVPCWMIRLRPGPAPPLPRRHGAKRMGSSSSGEVSGPAVGATRSGRKGKQELNSTTTTMTPGNIPIWPGIQHGRQSGPGWRPCSSRSGSDLGIRIVQTPRVGEIHRPCGPCRFPC